MNSHITKTMKKSITLLSFVIITTIAFGQNYDNTFFTEFCISVNRTDLKNNNTSDGFGFGIGTYNTLLTVKNLKFLFGVEFNRTTQFKENMYESKFSHATDLTYFINSISIPITAKFSSEKRVNFFCETGFFIDINIGASRLGTMHTYVPDENNEIVYKENNIEEKVSISAVNYGVSFGVGIEVPIANVKLIIKPEYKYGILALYDYKDSIYNRYFRILIGIKI